MGINAPKPQKFTPLGPGEQAKEWESIWHSGMDYIAPDADPNHPILTGEVSYVRSPQQLQQPEQ